MKLIKKNIVFTIFLLLTIFSFIPKSDVSALGVYKLQVFIGPSRVLADSGVYDAVFVQLLDFRSRPVRALEDITISLSSSLTDVGSIDPTIIIKSGETYARARFFSTYTAGSTTITAITSGYTSGQAVMTTYGPIPSKIAVYATPPTVPADEQAYESIIIQLQDLSGKPARAPVGDVEITLASSDISIGTVNSTVIIRSGKTYAVTKFYTTYKAGSTQITAIAPGYTSGQATMKTSAIGGAPSKLKVYGGPPKVSAEGISFEALYLQLEDSQGKITKAQNNTLVTLASSDVSVGTVNSSVIIGVNETYAVTKFYTTYKAGSTQITAIAPGYTSGQAVMTTYGPIPSKIAVYATPPTVPADEQAYESIIIQLQDSSGSPARDPIGDVVVILSSSSIEVGNINQTAVIHFGDTYTVTEFSSGHITGSTTITAVASGYTSGKASAKTNIIDPLLTVSVRAYPNSVGSDQKMLVKVYVTNGSLESSTPVIGAIIVLNSDGGGEFSSVTDEENGYYSSTFTAPTVEDQMVCNITAMATKHGYVRGEDQVTIIVSSWGNIIFHVQTSESNPIVGATVLSTSQPNGQLVLNKNTNNDGIVEFGNLKAGSYVFTVEKEGFDRSEIQVSIEAGQKNSQNIVLSPTVFWMLRQGWLLLVAVLLVPVVITATIFAILRSRKKKLNPKSLLLYKQTQPNEPLRKFGGEKVRGNLIKIRKDKRGLSPIFAVLILVAIAVIAGIIIYMFTSGYLATMMGGGTAGQEKVAVESVQWDGTTLTVWAKSTGGGNVIIDAVIVRDASGNQVDLVDISAATVTLDADGSLNSVAVTPTGIAAGETYTVALVSKQGGQFISPSFRG